jgi:L-ascorbate metabolism protein UlaG (beta-lactamase superfamily)
MEITWYGLSCFRLTERGLATVVTDPFDHRVTGYEALKLKADIVTISHDAPGHNYATSIRGKNLVITGPGEFEIGGVFITGVQTNGFPKRSPDEVRNTLYVFDFDGLTVAHLGDLKRVPGQAEIEALGNVHVVLVPVGGGGGLTATKAVEIVSLL